MVVDLRAESAVRVVVGRGRVNGAQRLSSSGPAPESGRDLIRLILFPFLAYPVRCVLASYSWWA